VKAYDYLGMLMSNNRLRSSTSVNTMNNCDEGSEKISVIYIYI